MKIILSPAKKMRVDTDTLSPTGLPVYIDTTKELLGWLRTKSFDELKALWNCNESIARLNYERLSDMDLHRQLTPAVLSYDGIAYQYMAPAIFEDGHFDYVQDHLRILSAFYGILKPMDGVVPYRLEMQARASVNGAKNLYEFWGSRLYEDLSDGSGLIINLASREYYKCIERYLKPSDTFLSIVFCEKSGDRLVTKGTYAKMARGEMVRFMAENAVQDADGIKGFDRLGYHFRPDISSEKELVFERELI